MSAHHCPTCGCPVRIGGKGTTHYYVPIRNEAADVLCGTAKEVANTKSNGVTKWLENMDALRKAISAYEEERDGRKG